LIQDHKRNATELPLVGNGVIKVDDFLAALSASTAVT
jgi:hypothetical protein